MEMSIINIYKVLPPKLYLLVKNPITTGIYMYVYIYIVISSP